MEDAICLKCNGDGFTAEHAEHPHPNGDCCGECPIQVQCEYCEGIGYVDFYKIGQREYQKQVQEKIKIQESNIDDLPF